MKNHINKNVYLRKICKVHSLLEPRVICQASNIWWWDGTYCTQCWCCEYIWVHFRTKNFRGGSSCHLKGWVKNKLKILFFCSLDWRQLGTGDKESVFFFPLLLFFSLLFFFFVLFCFFIIIIYLFIYQFFFFFFFAYPSIKQIIINNLHPSIKGVLHPRLVFGLFLHFSQNYNTLVTSKICFL